VHLLATVLFAIVLIELRQLEPAKRKSAIRQVAPSPQGDRVAVAEFKNRVYIWDIVKQSLISHFDTTLDFGGRRLALNSAGNLCVAAAYHIYGVACYEADTGREVWRRRDLKKVQYLSIPAGVERAYCCFDSGPARVLDLLTGRTVEELRGVRNIWFSPDARHYLIKRDGSDLELCRAGGFVLARFPKTSFAVLSASFSATAIFISEAAEYRPENMIPGTFRCYDLGKAQKLWSKQPESAAHFPRIAYCRETNHLYGVLWNAVRGGAHRLVKSDPESGNLVEAISLGEDWEPEFCLRNTHLILASGRVFSLATLSQLASLPFPQMDYPID